MIVIINYGTGNFQSLENSFQELGQEVKITDNPAEIKKAKKIVLIGVGNFGGAAKSLKERNLGLLIKEEISKGKPFLGICLGMQLLFETSQESPKIKGLGLFKGKCLKFKGVKVPQLGWNQVRFRQKAEIFKGVKNMSFFYFMHSFYVKPVSENLVAATTDYGKEFCSVVNFKNIFGVQFHPEKSGEAGLKIFKNFIKI